MQEGAVQEGAVQEGAVQEGSSAAAQVFPIVQRAPRPAEGFPSRKGGEFRRAEGFPSCWPPSCKKIPGAGIFFYTVSQVVTAAPFLCSVNQ